MDRNIIEAIKSVVKNHNEKYPERNVTNSQMILVYGYQPEDFENQLNLLKKNDENFINFLRSLKV